MTLTSNVIATVAAAAAESNERRSADLLLRAVSAPVADLASAITTSIGAFSSAFMTAMARSLPSAVFAVEDTASVHDDALTPLNVTFVAAAYRAEPFVRRTAVTATFASDTLALISRPGAAL